MKTEGEAHFRSRLAQEIVTVRELYDLLLQAAFHVDADRINVAFPFDLRVQCLAAGTVDIVIAESNIVTVIESNMAVETTDRNLLLEIGDVLELEFRARTQNFGIAARTYSR